MTSCTGVKAGSNLLTRVTRVPGGPIRGDISISRMTRWSTCSWDPPGRRSCPEPSDGEPWSTSAKIRAMIAVVDRNHRVRRAAPPIDIGATPSVGQTATPDAGAVGELRWGKRQPPGSFILGHEVAPPPRATPLPSRVLKNSRGYRAWVLRGRGKEREGRRCVTHR